MLQSAGNTRKWLWTRCSRAVCCSWKLPCWNRPLRWGGSGVVRCLQFYLFICQLVASGERCCGHLRYGRIVAEPDDAVYATVCQEGERKMKFLVKISFDRFCFSSDRWLAAGQCPVAYQGNPHCEPATHLQHRVCPIQAIPAREAEEADHFPRNRPRQSPQTHFEGESPVGVRRHPGHSAGDWGSVASAVGQVRSRVQADQLLWLQELLNFHFHFSTLCLSIFLSLDFLYLFYTSHCPVCITYTMPK